MAGTQYLDDILTAPFLGRRKRPTEPPPDSPDYSYDGGGDGDYGPEPQAKPAGASSEPDFTYRRGPAMSGYLDALDQERDETPFQAKPMGKLGKVMGVLSEIFTGKNIPREYNEYSNQQRLTDYNAREHQHDSRLGILQKAAGEELSEYDRRTQGQGRQAQYSADKARAEWYGRRPAKNLLTSGVDKHGMFTGVFEGENGQPEVKPLFEAGAKPDNNANDTELFISDPRKYREKKRIDKEEHYVPPDRSAEAKKRKTMLTAIATRKDAALQAAEKDMRKEWIRDPETGHYSNKDGEQLTPEEFADEIQTRKQRIQDSYEEQIGTATDETPEHFVVPGGGGQGGGKPMTPEIAKQYLSKAGGDKAKARQLATADGYDPTKRQ